ncbi:hypothetical protein C6496_04905 [Candidatus Poribacteria bacterium]|nr:MAG: hypothetical protein C6496_04905 [Candidatus Poribacteria bacterium]
MYFDRKKVPGIGVLKLICMKPNEDFRKEHDKIFEEVDDLSRIYCAVSSELSDVYRIWNIYGRAYTSSHIHLASEEREVPLDLLSLWTEVLILRTVRLTDKSNRNKSVSVYEFPKLNLDADLKKKVENLIEISKQKTDLLKKTRDQFIAHKDFVALEDRLFAAAPGFTIHDIADALESIGNILECIYNHYADISTDITFDVPRGFGGTDITTKY